MSSQNDPSNEGGGAGGGGQSGGGGGQPGGGQPGSGESAGGVQGSEGGAEEKTEAGHKTASKGINPVQHSE